MPFNPQALLGNLAERERVHGHHSPEGEAIRTLSRALDGWSSGNLAEGDVVALCSQAVEDWLKRRLNRSPWSVISLTELLGAAAAPKLLSASEVKRLQKLVDLRAQLSAGEFLSVEIDQIIESTIEIVEHHWS